MVDSLQEAGVKTIDTPPWAKETTETKVTFGVLLPEAQPCVQEVAQSRSHTTEKGLFKTEEVQAQNDSSSSISAQVKLEHGQEKSSVRVTAAADGRGGLQQLSDALIDR